MRKPSHATVIAYLALFVALGGTGYAAITLPKDSVGSKQIKSNAVVSSKVHDRSLLAKDFKKGQLPAGPRGPKGDRGPQGPIGPIAAGASGIFDPPPNPDGALVSAQIATPSSGRLLVSAYGRVLAQDCRGSCTLDVGLYVDGNPVPKTSHYCPSYSTCDYIDQWVGIAPNVPAGTHTVSLSYKVVGYTTVGSVGSHIWAIALGR
jgi:hypothetical protein